jgi:hypothetical protein
MIFARFPDGEDVLGSGTAIATCSDCGAAWAASDTYPPLWAADLLAVPPESAGAFRVEVFEVTGRRVAVLLEGPLTAGLHRLRWGGISSSGQRVAPGTYFMRAEVPGFRTTRKLVLVR